MRYYYTYKIEFETGHYYYGSRITPDGIKPDDDINYTGSPRKNKKFWQENKFKKCILHEYETYETLREAESKLIGNLFKDDSLCLNAANSGKFYQSPNGHWYYHETDSGVVEKYFKSAPPDEKWIRGKPSSGKSAQGKKWYYRVTNGESTAKLFFDNPDDSVWKRGRYPRQWYHCIAVHGGIKEIYCKAPPSDNWVLGKYTGPLRKRKFTKEHRENIKSAREKNREKYLGDNNVMRDPKVKSHHAEILKGPAYRMKVSKGVLDSERWTDKKRTAHRERQRKRMLENNPQSKHVVINGCQYKSIAAAMRTTGLSRPKIKALNSLL